MSGDRFIQIYSQALSKSITQSNNQTGTERAENEVDAECDGASESGGSHSKSVKVAHAASSGQVGVCGQVCVCLIAMRGV